MPLGLQLWSIPSILLASILIFFTRHDITHPVQPQPELYPLGNLPLILMACEIVSLTPCSINFFFYCVSDWPRFGMRFGLTTWSKLYALFWFWSNTVSLLLLPSVLSFLCQYNMSSDQNIWPVGHLFDNNLQNTFFLVSVFDCHKILFRLTFQKWHRNLFCTLPYLVISICKKTHCPHANRLVWCASIEVTLKRLSSGVSSSTFLLEKLINVNAVLWSNKAVFVVLLNI